MAKTVGRRGPIAEEGRRIGARMSPSILIWALPSERICPSRSVRQGAMEQPLRTASERRSIHRGIADDAFDIGNTGRTFLLCGLVLALGGHSPAADEKKVGPPGGDAAPAFEATDDRVIRGNRPTTSARSTSSSTSTRVISHPAVPGRHKKFRDNMNKLNDQGIEVVGVSGDSATSHGLLRKSRN